MTTCRGKSARLLCALDGIGGAGGRSIGSGMGETGRVVISVVGTRWMFMQLGSTLEFMRGSITVVTPVGPNHLSFVPRHLRNIYSNCVAHVEVVLAPSAPIPGADRLLKTYPNLRILEPLVSATAALNRNRGWDVATTDFVAFCDVDDYYLPWRLEVMESALITHGADVGYHGYLHLRSPRFMATKGPRSPAVISPESIAAVNEGRVASLDDTARGRNNLHFPGNVVDAHLAHVVVRRTVRNRFPLIRHGEDGVFGLQCLRSGHRILLVNAVLSIYDPLTVGTLARFAQGRARHHASTWIRGLGLRPRKG